MNTNCKPTRDITAGLTKLSSSVRGLILSLPESSDRASCLGALEQVLRPPENGISMAFLPLDSASVDFVSTVTEETRGDHADAGTELPRVAGVYADGRSRAVSELCSDPPEFAAFLADIDLLIVVASDEDTPDQYSLQSVEDVTLFHPATLKLNVAADSQAGAADLIARLQAENSPLTQAVVAYSRAIRLERLLDRLASTLECEMERLQALDVCMTARLETLATDRGPRDWQIECQDLHRWAAGEVALIHRGVLANAKAITQPGSPFHGDLIAEVDSITESGFATRSIGKRREITLDDSICRGQVKTLVNTFRTEVSDQLALLRDETEAFLEEFNTRAHVVGGIDDMDEVPLPTLGSIMVDEISPKAPDAPRGKSIPRPGLLSVLFAGRRTVFTVMFLMSMTITALGMGAGGGARNNPYVGVAVLVLFLGTIPFVLVSSLRTNRQALDEARESIRNSWAGQLERYFDSYLRIILQAFDRELRALEGINQNRLVAGIDRPVRSRDDALRDRREEIKQSLRSIAGQRNGVAKKLDHLQSLRGGVVELEDSVERVLIGSIEGRS